MLISRLCQTDRRMGHPVGKGGGAKVMENRKGEYRLDIGDGRWRIYLKASGAAQSAAPEACARDGSGTRRRGAGARPGKRRLTAGSRRFSTSRAGPCKLPLWRPPGDVGKASKGPAWK